MKYLLLLISLSANADCFYDVYGNQTCINSQPNYFDMRDGTNSPKIIEGNKYRGNLNNNIFDQNSINNPLGPYGNQFSKDSIKNPFRER